MAGDYTPDDPTPDYSSPEYSTPDYSSPEYSTPDYSSPEYSSPDYTSPEYSSPDYSSPEYSSPDYTSPEYSSPDYTSPEYSPPGYSPPYEPPVDPTPDVGSYEDEPPAGGTSPTVDTLPEGPPSSDPPSPSTLPDDLPGVEPPSPSLTSPDSTSPSPATLAAVSPDPGPPPAALPDTSAIAPIVSPEPDPAPPVPGSLMPDNDIDPQAGATAPGLPSPPTSPGPEPTAAPPAPLLAPGAGGAPGPSEYTDEYGYMEADGSSPALAPAFAPATLPFAPSTPPAPAGTDREGGGLAPSPRGPLSGYDDYDDFDGGGPGAAAGAPGMPRGPPMAPPLPPPGAPTPPPGTPGEGATTADSVRVASSDELRSAVERGAKNVQVTDHIDAGGAQINGNFGGGTEAIQGNCQGPPPVVNGKPLVLRPGQCAFVTSNTSPAIAIDGSPATNSDGTSAPPAGRDSSAPGARNAQVWIDNILIEVADGAGAEQAAVSDLVSVVNGADVYMTNVDIRGDGVTPSSGIGIDRDAAPGTTSSRVLLADSTLGGLVGAVNGPAPAIDTRGPVSVERSTFTDIDAGPGRAAIALNGDQAVLRLVEAEFTDVREFDVSLADTVGVPVYSDDAQVAIRGPDGSLQRPQALNAMPDGGGPDSTQSAGLSSDSPWLQGKRQEVAGETGWVSESSVAPATAGGGTGVGQQSVNAAGSAARRASALAAVTVALLYQL